jgi:hypothetical protein
LAFRDCSSDCVLFITIKYLSIYKKKALIEIVDLVCGQAISDGTNLSPEKYLGSLKILDLAGFPQMNWGGTLRNGTSKLGPSN